MKLKDWLESKCISVPKFCKYNEFCEESIYAYNKGSVPRTSIALKIVKATGGQVSLEDLGLDQEAIEKVRIKQQKLRDKRDRQKARNQERAAETSDSLLTASGS